jgi:hypothetical protein
MDHANLLNGTNRLASVHLHFFGWATDKYLHDLSKAGLFVCTHE